MSAKKKFYAVVAGRKPGIYKTWSECKAQVDGYPNAIYKGFVTEDEAKGYMKQQKKGKEYEEYELYAEYDKESLIDLSGTVENVMFAFVDGSFDENNGYGSGAVTFLDGKYSEWYRAGNNSELMPLRNIAGEIEAAKYVADKAVKSGADKVVIFYDYAGIEAWATKAWKANKEYTKDYAAYMEGVMKKIKVTFVKIAGHTGILLNEEADRLAKLALGI